MKVVENVIAGLLGAIFIFSGVVKIIDPELFYKNILEYRIFPRLVAVAGALYLPWLELFAGIFVLFYAFRKPASLLIALLNLFFIIIVSIVLVKGIKPQCGCFGPFSEEASLSLIVRDFVFFVMSLFLFLRS